eukprot:gene677-975_t
MGRANSGGPPGGMPLQTYLSVHQWLRETDELQGLQAEITGSAGGTRGGRRARHYIIHSSQLVREQQQLNVRMNSQQVVQSAITQLSSGSRDEGHSPSGEARPGSQGDDVVVMPQQ